MGYIYVFRRGTEDLFRLGRTKEPVLGECEDGAFTEFARIETADHAASEAFLHQRLRSKRVRKKCCGECFEICPSELAQVLHEAEEFVAEYLGAKQRAEEFADLEEDATLRSVIPSANDLEIFSKLIQVRDAQDRLKVRQQFYESKLKVSIGVSSGLRGIATWKGKWQQHFDLAAFRQAEGELYSGLFSRFGTETYRRTFRIQR